MCTYTYIYIIHVYITCYIYICICMSDLRFNMHQFIRGQWVVCSKAVRGPAPGEDERLVKCEARGVARGASRSCAARAAAWPASVRGRGWLLGGFHREPTAKGKPLQTRKSHVSGSMVLTKTVIVASTSESRGPKLSKADLQPFGFPVVLGYLGSKSPKVNPFCSRSCRKVSQPKGKHP